jgi:hypothetical protein
LIDQLLPGSAPWLAALLGDPALLRRIAVFFGLTIAGERLVFWLWAGARRVSYFFYILPQ